MTDIIHIIITQLFGVIETATTETTLATSIRFIENETLVRIDVSYSQHCTGDVTSTSTLFIIYAGDTLSGTCISYWRCYREITMDTGEIITTFSGAGRTGHIGGTDGTGKYAAGVRTIVLMETGVVHTEITESRCIGQTTTTVTGATFVVVIDQVTLVRIDILDPLIGTSIVADPVTKFIGSTKWFTSTGAIGTGRNGGEIAMNTGKIAPTRPRRRGTTGDREVTGKYLTCIRTIVLLTTGVVHIKVTQITTIWKTITTVAPRGTTSIDRKALIGVDILDSKVITSLIATVVTEFIVDLQLDTISGTGVSRG